jgi:thiamine biosynthesis lipoprotein
VQGCPAARLQQHRRRPRGRPDRRAPAGHGRRSFVAEATGELKAVGRKPDGSPGASPWNCPAKTAIARQIIPVDGLSVSTSGDYRHYFEQNGRRYSHTFDARLGRPVEHDLAPLRCSRLGADGRWLSTLLLILGPEQGWDLPWRMAWLRFW